MLLKKEEGEALMAEVNTPRVMAAAKEFNIGKDTLVDFLVSKGFEGDESKAQLQNLGRNVPCFAG